MSVTIVTFANFGKKKNLPTADMLPVIDVFQKHHLLERVVCQLEKDSSITNIVPAVPFLVRSTIRVVEKLLGRSLPRRYTEELYDFFAQFRLLHSAVVLFHRGYFLPRTLRVARERGSVTIDLCGTAHFAANQALEQSELDALGISGYRSTYTMLHRSDAHYLAFDYVIAMSEFAKQTYIDAGYPRERLYVAYPDVDTVRFTPLPNPAPGFKVVYAAYTTPIKGLGYLLDAWESLKLPGAELILVGGYGDMPPSLRQLYDDRIAHDPSIVWIESTNAPEEYYQSAALFVSPSLSEGFGRVTLEAMACGVPVVTTENARGIVEEGKTGFIVPIRDADALAEKIRHLYHNQGLARSMGAAARVAVEQKKSFGEKILEIHQDILMREGKV